MFLTLGVDSFLCLLAAVGLGLALAGRSSASAARFARWGAWALFLAAFLPVCLGTGGYFLQMQQVEGALAAVDEHARHQIYSAGQDEAIANVWLGGGSALCFGLTALLVLGLASSASEASASDPIE